MTEEEIMEEIAVAAGYGLAALSLQGAIAVKLALHGLLSASDLAQVAESAEQMVGAGVVDASEGAVLIAQSAIRGLAHTWQKSDKPN
jgi:hypothetical protein